jgi:transposase
MLSGIRWSDPMSKEEQVLSPNQRIKELEVQLKEAQAKAQLFEAMLNVIRKEYGVKLPKSV